MGNSTEGSLFSKGASYLSDSVEELKKVSFPTRQETMQATIATLVIVVFVASTLALLDFAFNALMIQILG